MMGGRFVKWSGDQVRARMREIGFVEVDLPGVNEAVFERQTNTPDVTIRVYTSVWAHGEDVRRVGTDAGRVLLIHVRDAQGGSRRREQVLWKGKRVHRTKGFLDNLRDRCREAWRRAAYWPEWKCPKCGGPMIGRNRKGQIDVTFMGCLSFPGCRGTRNINNGGG